MEDNEEYASFPELRFAKRQAEALERIAGALERIADQGDEIESSLSALVHLSGKFADAAITEGGELVIVTVKSE